MRIAISGASGFIGRALVAHLKQSGHEVIRLIRGKQATSPSEVTWDPAKGELDTEALRGLDAFVNLSGENLGERWSEERKEEFRASRLLSATLIATTLARVEPKPTMLISGSAIGIYGNDRGDELLTESSTLGDDFLARLCRDWESATAPASDAGIRVVHTRSGIVLNPEGGVLGKLVPIFKLGAGGKVGGGEQWVSWISRTDIARAIGFLIERSELSGAVNMTSPNPVTNEELARELGRALHRPAVAPVPATMVRLMLGREMADETVLASQRVVSSQLTHAGFEFLHPTLPMALEHELHQSV